MACAHVEYYWAVKKEGILRYAARQDLGVTGAQESIRHAFLYLRFKSSGRDLCGWSRAWRAWGCSGEGEGWLGAGYGRLSVSQQHVVQW